MKKKNYILLTCFLYSVILFATVMTVSAEEAHHHPLCDSSETLLWKSISEANEIIGDGSYYLTEDIVLSTDLVIDSNINLCLNGHKIDVSEKSGLTCVKVSENGILNICDCSGNDSGIITSAKDTSTIVNNGIINLYSGSLGRTVENTTCIVENKTGAVMNMYGGKIHGETIAIKTKGSFNAYGGSITGTRGAFQIEGGETMISETAVIDCSGDDWATISLYGGTLNISGGTIENSGCSTVIYLPYGQSCLNISGGTISVSGKTNCIYATSADAEISISGGTIKCDSETISYDNSHNYRYGWGINAVAFKSLTLSGSPFVDNIYLYDTHTLTIPSSGLQNKTPIGIFCRSYPLAFTSQNNADYSDRFTCKAPNSAYILYNDNNNQIVFAMKKAINGKVSLEGKPNVNEILTAVYTPAEENETYIYQWYCDNVAIEGETKSTYKIKPEDINKKIKVIISGTGFYRETKTAEVTIVKNAIDYTPPVANRFEFNGTDQPLVTAGECHGGVIKYRLSENSEYSEEIPKATNAGRYIIYYRAFGDAYHTDGAVSSVMARITAKDITNAEVLLGDDLVYNGAEQVQSIQSVKADGLDVTYEVSGEKATTYNSEGYILTITGNGNFTGTKEIVYNIKQAVPLQNPDKPTTARIYKGKKLSEASVTNGEFFAFDATTVLDGTFSWVDDTETINADTTKRMKFIPADTNYAEIEFDVTVDSYTSGGALSFSPTTYTVKFETNGGNEIDSVKVTKNKSLTEPTAPSKDGYIFDGWYLDKELSNPYNFEEKITGSFVLYAKWKEDNNNEPQEPNSHHCPSSYFDDLIIAQWYHPDTDYVLENGLFNGTSKTTFEPDAVQTRAMMVTVLYRTEGEPAVNGNISFSDVDMGAYYANAVIWGQQNGIIMGYSKTQFGPDDNITREQIATIMHRYSLYKGIDVSIGENTNILSYNDFDEISEYAIASMQWAVGSGLIKGRSAHTLNPLENATRAEIAAILHRFIESNK